MAIEDWTVHQVSIDLGGVSLLPSEEEQREFARKLDSEITVRAVPDDLPHCDSPMRDVADPGEPHTVIHVVDEQVIIGSTAGFTLVAMPQPRFDDLVLLTRVASHAIHHTDSGTWPVRRLTFHLYSEYRQLDEEDAEAYLSNRLFPGQRFTLDQWSLVGGDAKIRFETQGSDRREWTFDVKRLPKDPSRRIVRQYAAMATIDQLLLTGPRLLALLEEIWNGSMDFANRLDRSA